ncbi:MAG: hypothetical protein RR614_10900, partial [Eubacterium sp.]
MKKKKNILIVVAILAIVAAVGSTMAAFVASTTTNKEVSTSEMGIKIVQQEGNGAKGVKKIEATEGKGSGFQYAGMPGDTVEEAVKVANTKSKDCYVRVTINRSWQDKNGEKDFELSPEEIEIIRNNDAWIVSEDPKDPEVIYCYYKSILTPGQSSENVMDSFSILKNSLEKNSNAYAGYQTNITFEADAVQAVKGDASARKAAL